METSIPWFSCLVELHSEQEKDNKEEFSTFSKSLGNSLVLREPKLGYTHRWTVHVRLRLLVLIPVVKGIQQDSSKILS